MVNDELQKETMNALFQDLRYGLRMLAKSPGFTAVAVVTLALGIGANTAIFSLLNAVMLRRLPVSRPDELVEFFTRDRSGRISVISFPLFEEIERRQRVFSGLFAWWGDGVFNAEANGTLVRADIYAVTGNFYSELGVTPFLGRLLTPADVNLRGEGPAYVAVLGYGFWQRQYGGDWGVLGRTVRVEGVPFTVVGVTAQGFKGMGLASAPDVTIPLTAEPIIRGNSPERLYTNGRFWLSATGRLKPGVTLAQARAQVESFWKEALKATLPTDYTPQQQAEYLATPPELVSAANGIDWYLRAHFVRPLYVLMGISGLILLITCVNVGSLLVARGAARSHEMGIRSALGASIGRLARQLLTESVLLSGLGAAAGFLLACWGSVALSDYIMGGYLVPSALNVGPDLRVLSFTAAVAISAGILFGLAPVWQITSRRLAGVMQQSSRTVGRPAARLGKGLISTQVALSLIQLMGAGLFVRSLHKLEAIEPGFRSESILDTQLFPRPLGYERLNNLAYYSELIEHISSLPGVSGAALCDHRPAGGYERWEPVSAGSSAAATTARSGLALVSPGFFETLSIGFLRGRDFNWRDNDHSPRVAILSQSLAHHLFPSEDAIGQRIKIGSYPRWQNLEVVGIVRDARLFDVRSPEMSIAYVDIFQPADLAHWGDLEVRVAGDPTAAAAAVKRTIESLGHEYVLKMRTLNEVKEGALLSERVIAMLSEFFGALALLLAAAGLYGLMAYSVAQRTREIGLRMALGAQRESVLWMVLRETLTVIMLGVAIGVPGALAAARLLRHMLFGLSPDDPLTLGAVSLGLVVATALAGTVPARRAMKVDPMVALRYE